MKPEKLLLELESIIEKSGYRLRKERGSFKGADCIIEGDKLIVVNKNKPIEVQLGTIAKFLSEINLTETYIKPGVRKQLEKLWSHLSVRPAYDNGNWELS